MKKVVQFMHVSLDGFVGGPNGEMDWIKVDEEIFDFAGERTSQSDAALYGRNTWLMMDGYWPTAADQPNPSKHDIEHSAWYMKINKYVMSRTMQSIPEKKVTVIGANLTSEVQSLKSQAGKEIVIFGSPGAGRSLAMLGLVDEYWLFVNPVILGKGIPLFAPLEKRANLTLLKTHPFKSGVVCLHYSVNRD